MKQLIHSIVLFSMLILGNNFTNAQSSSTYKNAEDEKNFLAQEYIAKFKHFAIQEMQKTGIPASITLAQGLHESDYGRSRLATLANNHFGAKAHNTWVGPTITHTDDAPDEHFRKYNSVEHSYRDHSKVLAKKRYAFLYRLNPYDYKAWSHGLKKAGYATDPNYAYKLIKIIENYSLYIYDNPNYEVPNSEPTYVSATYTKPVETYSKPRVLQPNEAGYISESYTKPLPSNTKKATKAKRKKVLREKENYVPIQTKEVAQVIYSDNPEESVKLAMREEIAFKKPPVEWYYGNRVVYFDKPIMPSQVAFWLEIDLDKLLKWNYTHAHIPFEKNKPIYLETLRTKSGSMGNKTYTALRKQTLVDVALASGIRLERLMKLNKMDNPLDYISPGELVQLKRKARKAPKTIAKHHFEIVAQIPVRSAYLTTLEVNHSHSFDMRITESLPTALCGKKYDEISTTQDYSSTNKMAENIAVNYARTTYTSSNLQADYTPTISYDSNEMAFNNNSSNSKSVINAVDTPTYHTVQKGETLYRLSVIYQVSVDTIKELNNFSDNTIKIGSSVRVK